MKNNQADKDGRKSKDSRSIFTPGFSRWSGSILHISTSSAGPVDDLPGTITRRMVPVGDRRSLDVTGHSSHMGNGEPSKIERTRYKHAEKKDGKG